MSWRVYEISAHTELCIILGTPVFTPKTDLAEEFDELKIDQSNSKETLISKQFPGSFAETSLDKVIQESGKKKLVLTGYMAHVCVSTTAREAHQKGYEVLIAEDAIGDRDIPGASGEQVTKVGGVDAQSASG